MAQSGSHDITSDDEDINHVSASVTGPHGYMGNGASMKPKFDAMLKEIEQKLPSLDDDDSDFEVCPSCLGLFLVCVITC